MTEPSRRRVSLGIAFALILLSLLLLITMGWGWQPSEAWSVAFAWFVGWLALGVGCFFLLSAFYDSNSSALLRLDWYVPVLKRIPGDASPAKSRMGRWFRRALPESWQSNWRTKKRGKIRTALRRVGISWLASPVRRIVQSLCLLSFLALFFYACWPYDAKPQFAAELGTYRFEGFDQAQGHLTFEPEKSVSGEFELELLGSKQGSASEIVAFAAPAWAAPGSDALLGRFRIVDASPDQLTLTGVGEPSTLLLNVITGQESNRDFQFYDRDPQAWPEHYAQNLSRKEWIPAETFLMIDPLVSLSTAIASRSWVWSLACALAILLVCVIIPRGFCGYLCPLGTTIDLFDWAIASRVRRFRVADDGWWVHTKYYLLAAILIAACGGVLISGYFSAIPVITRGMLFVFDPLQNGLLRGWHLVPNLGLGQFLSIALFLGVLCLGFLRPRFWCKYVCPSGATFSIGNLFRLTERKVESSCIHCNKCVEICPFDAIKPDFTTRETDCTLCQSCAGVCPTHAIKFVERWNVVELKVENDPPTHETTLGRRGFLSLAAGTAAATAGGVGSLLATKAWGATSDGENSFLPVRPPGSVPEQEFLEMCIRCGECFKACPNNVLQPEGFQQGLEGLWTPFVNADWAGCESSCNACGQVCPTGAIRALPMEEKRVARMGLAIVNESTCLPFAGSEECDLCVQECDAAGYHAIEYTQVGVELDDAGQPVEGTGFSAPFVLADRCVGCGLCQTRCVAINVKKRKVLKESAIIVEAGEGKEDRLMSGSYLELRKQEKSERGKGQPSQHTDAPASSRQKDSPTERAQPENSDPFGIGDEGAADAAADPFGVGNTDADPDPFGTSTGDEESPF